MHAFGIQDMTLTLRISAQIIGFGNITCWDFGFFWKFRDTKAYKKYVNTKSAKCQCVNFYFSIVKNKATHFSRFSQTNFNIFLWFIAHGGSWSDGVVKWYLLIASDSESSFIQFRADFCRSRAINSPQKEKETDSLKFDSPWDDERIHPAALAAVSQ